MSLSLLAGGGQAFLPACCSAGGKIPAPNSCQHLVFAFQNTHQPQKPKEDLAKKAAVLLTPKQEPVETPVSKISDDSSSSTEEDEPPSSPELRKTKRSRFQRKTVNKSKGSGWTCSVCHSWFPERDEYVSHMKKDHGKVRRRPGALAPEPLEMWAGNVYGTEQWGGTPGPGACSAAVWALLLAPVQTRSGLRFWGAGILPVLVNSKDQTLVIQTWDGQGEEI